MRNFVAMERLKLKLRCLKPHRPYTVLFPICAREMVNNIRDVAFNGLTMKAIFNRFQYSLYVWTKRPQLRAFVLG